MTCTCGLEAKIKAKIKALETIAQMRLDEDEKNPNGEPDIGLMYLAETLTLLEELLLK